MSKRPFREHFSTASPRRRQYIGAALGLLLAVVIGILAWNRTPSPIAPAALNHTYAEALEQAHNGKPGAARMLYQQLARTDLSDIRRASLLAELGNYPSPQALKLLSNDLQNPSAQVRLAAIETSNALVPDATRIKLLGPLLEDTDANVRFNAVRALLNLTPDDLGVYFSAVQRGIDDYSAALNAQPSSAQSQMQLARLLVYQGNRPKALAALKLAATLEPKNLDVGITHVELLDKPDETEQARQLLKQLLAQHPDSARLQHALGQWLLHHDQAEYALLALAKALELEPENNGYRYDLAVALHDLDQLEAAQKQLAEILQRQPANRRARAMLILYWKENGQLQNVQVLLAELEQQNPDDPILQQAL